MPTVKLENLTKRFDDIVALDGVNLDIRDQEFFVLLGQTGAGKTTTLRCIAGLDLPENGAIYLDNQQINHLTPAERDVAFVFQAHILYPHLTVYENMAFPLHPRGLSEDEIRTASRKSRQCCTSNISCNANRINSVVAKHNGLDSVGRWCDDPNSS